MSRRVRQLEAFPAGKEVKDLLPAVLKKIDERQAVSLDLIRKQWASLLGEKYASMTQVMEFREGVLTIKVQSAPLFSILTGMEKTRLENEFRKKMPKINLKKLNFRR